jgi:photosystem II stability/assembly factor-like uncharacterized protein
MVLASLLRRGGRRRALSVFLLTVAAALISLSGAQSSVNAPASGWFSGNPSLGPANLTSLVSAGGTTYAGGDSGTLLKSLDGGLTWSGITTGIRDPITILQVVGANPASVVFGTGSLLERSDNGGATFVRLPFAHGGAGLISAAFPSAQVGYLVLSNGSVLTTADGGKTFTRKTAIPGDTPDHLIAVSNTTAFAVTGSGTIQRTTDGAVSWTQVASVSVPLNGIARADATTMYAVGNALTVLKSTDSGATWAAEPVTGVPAGDLTSISTAGPKVALIATATGNQVLRTTDGGSTFTSVVPSSDVTHAVAFATAVSAITVGAYGSAQVSSDGGANWSIVGSRIHGPFRVLRAVSSLAAYAGGDEGVLARTVDGGQSWANVSPPTSARVVAIAAPRADTVFVLAADGSLQRSDNGGASYRILDTGTAVLPRAMVALDSNHVLLVGPAGVRRSTDGGERFQAVAAPILQKALLTGAERVGGAVLAYGPKRLVVSKDGGATWKAVKLPNKNGIKDASFGTARSGYVLDTHGELWQTKNAGKTWDAIECLGSWRVVGVDFADAKHGFALVSPMGPAQPGAYLLRTIDGGKDWHPQYLSGGTVTALDSAGVTSYVLVGDSVLYATKSGGDAGASTKLTIAAKPRSVAKPTTVRIHGTLKPSHGGDDVMISRYMGDRWQLRHVTVASNGTFSTRWTVTKTAVFVAQAYGDADRASAGTPALTVKRVPAHR